MFLFCSMYEIRWMGKPKSSPQPNLTTWMAITLPAIRSTSTRVASFTAVDVVIQNKDTWSVSAIQIEPWTKSMRQPSRKRPSSVTQGTTWLKCGGVTGPNRKKPIPSSQNSLKTSNLSHRLSRETRSLGVERALRPCTPKQQKTKRFPMWILQACIRVLRGPAPKKRPMISD